MKDFLNTFNAIMKENDEFYRNAARKFGISECALWIFYTIRNSSEPLTQKAIVDNILIPPQTVNSALKKLEKDGLVELLNDKDKRSKHVYLTERGEKLAQNTADRLISAEIEALESLEKSELEIFLNIFRKYTDFLVNTKIISEDSGNEQL